MIRFIWGLLVALVVSCGVNTTGEPPVLVNIVPSVAILEPGEVKTFKASVSQVVNGSVRWAVDAGNVEIEGNTLTYTSPEEEGRYTITATSVEVPNKRATASVTVLPAVSPNRLSELPRRDLPEIPRRPKGISTAPTRGR